MFVFAAHYQGALLDLAHGLEPKGGARPKSSFSMVGRMSLLPQRSKPDSTAMNGLVDQVQKHLRPGVTFAVSAA